MRIPLSIALAILVIGGALRPASSLADPQGKGPSPGDAADLAPPVAITVGGVPIDLAVDAAKAFAGTYMRDDNSFPWVGDVDGDGKLDLLVGQHCRGKARGGHLRIYRNLGTNAEPRLAEPIWFDDKVPTGVIPHG